MLNVGIGQAEELDVLAATRKAIAQIRQQLGAIFPDVAIVLAGIEFDHRLMLREILAAFPGVRIVGCTTAGDFSSSLSLSEYSISLMVFQSDELEFNVGIGRNVTEQPAQAARDAVQEAREGLTFDEKLCLVFPDGLCPANTRMITALNGELLTGCSIFGGASGRHTSEASQPLQFYQDEVVQDSIPLLIVAGNIDYSFSISNCWTPIGRNTTITEVDGRVVKRIGDMRALDFYRHYLGDHSKPASEFPLAVRHDATDAFYMRVPVSYDEDNASVTFGAPIPANATVQLSETTSARIVENLRSSTRDVIRQHNTKNPAAVLAFSCNARKGILGTQVDQELASLQQSLQDSVPILGFYGFAEFSPLERGEDCQLHHSTMITLLLGKGPNKSSAGREVLPSMAAPATMEEETDIATIQRENIILRKKLERSEYHRQGLEQTRDSDAILLKKINTEIEGAREELASEKENADQLLLNILPKEIAEELKRNGYVEPIYYPCASVLFADFQGFTAIARTLTPKQLVAELDFYFTAFDRVIERYKLEKLKTIGDAYMCAGGIPGESRGHINNIVGAAWDIQLFMSNLKRKKQARGEPFWELRCGVHAGPLMAGVIGSKKFAYDIWGDAVNIASRLESSAEVGKVNISKSVYDVIQSEFQCEPRGHLQVKNRGEIDMYFVTGRIN